MSVDAWCVFSSMFICLRISALVLSGLVPLNRKMHEWKLDKYNCFLRKENSIFRLRKWLVARISSIIDNHQVKRQEDLIMDMAR